MMRSAGGFDSGAGLMLKWGKGRLLDVVQCGTRRGLGLRQGEAGHCRAL